MTEQLSTSRSEQVGGATGRIYVPRNSSGGQRDKPGRHVTNGAQCGAVMTWVPSGHNNEFQYVKNALCERSGVLFSSEPCNESGMQPGQGFLFHSNNRSGVNPSMAAGLRGKLGLSILAATSVHEQVGG